MDKRLQEIMSKALKLRRELDLIDLTTLAGEAADIYSLAKEELETQSMIADLEAGIEEENKKEAALPDWCKVGAIGYDNKLREYFKITQIDNDTVMAKLIESSGYCSYHYFNEFCSEARKRPFNSKEMKNLAGSFATTFDGDVSIIIDYDWFAEKVKICGEWLCAEELMESTWRVYNKPCYKLEHLENGEWVE